MTTNRVNVLFNGIPDYNIIIRIINILFIVLSVVNRFQKTSIQYCNTVQPHYVAIT